MTYGSWHPGTDPGACLVREAYGTRARDTDWMDGFYPYHEMDTYLGVVGLFLAAVGAAAYRDRWVAFWLILLGLGVLLMLGRFTFLMDHLNKVPIVGSGRIPVRYHLWVSLAAAVLAGVGVDRLARPGRVRIGGAVAFVGLLVAISIPILIYVYQPAWGQPSRWSSRDHLRKFGWLGRELSIATVRTAILGIGAMYLAARAANSESPRLRGGVAGLLALLALADVAGAHWYDVPTVDPSYWTATPRSVAALRADPSRIRIYGEATFSSGEPGFASHPVDFLAVRDGLAWSLPVVWQLPATAGITPIVPQRWLRFTEASGGLRFDIEGLTHILSASPAENRLGPATPAGPAYLHRNPRALPRARFLGRPVHAATQREANRAMRQLGPSLRDRIVVEDPDRPMKETDEAIGTAKITHEEPERVEVEVIAKTPGYLFLADSFDPGWSATANGRAVPIRPAILAFRAVFLPAGPHTVVFSYRPAGFVKGLMVTGLGSMLALVGLVWPRPIVATVAAPRELLWRHYGVWMMAGAIVAVAISVFIPVELPSDSDPRQLISGSRWRRSFHRFTWGAGIEAMKPPKPPED